MKSKVSFLLGSGFSIPEGLPGVKELNTRLSKIDESEIIIHSSQIAGFLNGQPDPNRFSNADERKFVQEFLEFYNSEVLTEGEKFHYETFYDFYSGYIHNSENSDQIESFCNRFNERFDKDSPYIRDTYNRIINFNRTFNQLVASQLQKLKYHESVSCLNYYPYDSFVGFIRHLLPNYEVKVHSLNHDLFFDWLGQHHADLWQHYCDGYQLEGSPFYGLVDRNININPEHRISKTNHIKLARFTNNFDKSLAFFKLHGSVVNIILNTPEPNHQRVRIKSDYGVFMYYMEQYDEASQKYQFERLWDQVDPDFLSGTTNKSRFYVRDPFYVNMLDHFKQNLESSEALIVIGYGFQDPGINDYLENHFLSKGKKMIVIDPFKPKTELIEKYGSAHVLKGVTELSYQEYCDLFPAA